MADYALAAGGGQVTAHSPLAHGSHAPATYHLTRLAAEVLRKLPLLGRLVPRTPVHPKADEVRALLEGCRRCLAQPCLPLVCAHKLHQRRPTALLGCAGAGRARAPQKADAQP